MLRGLTSEQRIHCVAAAVCGRELVRGVGAGSNSQLLYVNYYIIFSGNISIGDCVIWLLFSADKVWEETNFCWILLGGSRVESFSLAKQPGGFAKCSISRSNTNIVVNGLKWSE